jgi:hypothetical protein
VSFFASGRHLYYNRAGEPCTVDEMIEGREGNFHVAETRMRDFWISTAFLGINHQYNLDGPPLIFETMAFLESKNHVGQAKVLDTVQLRYSTEQQAALGHKLVVEWVRSYNRTAARQARLRRYMKRRA